MSPTDSHRRRVAAVFGLTLLEVLRAQDFPAEILQDEDPTRTLPRRLGLSDVVERQIRQYREAVRKRRRMTDTEVTDLIRLVLRRPDSEEVFLRAGRRLAGSGSTGSGALIRVLPPSMVFGWARRRTRRRLSRLFGRRIGVFAPAPFALEGRSLLFYESDPGGDACHFVTGLCQAVVEVVLGPDARVVHAQCQSRGDELCRWTATAEARVRDREREREREGMGELLRGPELEAG